MRQASVKMTLKAFSSVFDTLVVLVVPSKYIFYSPKSYALDPKLVTELLTFK